MAGLPKFPDERLLVGFDTSDDACVYKLREDLAVIQTLDFFPPIVDDPYLFGQVAAANALSDVYAMGGSPTLALNILCIPNCLTPDTIKAILEGGYSKVKEAGAIIAGGHSIEDPEPKYGLCVSGFIHPDAVWSNATAREGDALILTKPLGSGITTTAAKADVITPAQFRSSVEAMSTLNKYARDVAAELAGGISACTDITGFGLLGHAVEMADGSGRTIELDSGAVPILPEAAELAKMGIIPKGAYRNREYMQEKVAIAPAVPLHLQDILFDPQTSGGLLLSVPEARAAELRDRLLEVCPHTAIVGRVLPRGDVSIRVI